MDTDKIIVYKAFDNPTEAHIVKGLLDSQGIDSFLSNENFVTLYPLYNVALGGVQLNVFEKDLDRINEIVASENMEPLINHEIKEQDKIICPFCGSGNVSYGSSTNKRFGLATLAFSFLFMIYPFKIRKAYHCFACHGEFKKTN
jgi:DNA-directed RNA polymerase subunit RPC12/RpoP